MEFKIEQGVLVNFNGQPYKIKAPLSLDKVLVESLISKETLSVDLSNLKPTNEQKATQPSVSKAVLEYTEQEWETAKKREKLIKPYVSITCSRENANKISKLLGVSSRYVYKLINLYQQSGSKLESLLPKLRNGGVGKSRLPLERENIIQLTIDELYLSKQKFKPSYIIEEIQRRCYYSNLKSPSEQTIRRRIKSLNIKEVLTKREGVAAARKNNVPIVGSFPDVSQPLSVFQIDHTPVDVIIVDEYHRKPIGRPYLTAAIDIFSRCIAGFSLSLESPSAISVGLCLSHSILDKETWLAERNIETSWPIWGKPGLIYVDNAKEFHSEALQRGCDVHGIQIDYRPLGQPHFGGHIERVIGTFMQLVHQIPGTTFSNVVKRGNYPSEKKAVLTLCELEKWLTIAITEYYHQKIHTGLCLPPIAKFKLGILGDEKHKGCGYFPRIQNKKAFLIDFLPIERRTLQRYGFMLDHISYYSNVLSPMIASRENYDPFIIRRDPRDISRIYILDPDSHCYLEIPYRNLSRPTVTLWEHRQAIKQLQEKGLEIKDEERIFKAIEAMRTITKEASGKSKSARRQVERTEQAQRQSTPIETKPGDKKADWEEVPKPFEDIEIW